MEVENRILRSPFVVRVTRVICRAKRRNLVEPDGTWGFIFRDCITGAGVLQTGQIDRPVELDCEAGDTYFSIAFKPEVFMPKLPGSAMVRRAIFHSLASRKAVWVCGERLEIPTFDNVEQFVARLAATGLIARDPVVGRAVEGSLRRLNDRTLERHFAAVTGLTGKTLQQVLRANQAVKWLREGHRIADVAADLGYADQAHLTHSLRRIMGRTPGQILGQAGL
jgi:hypothetical protein